MALGTKSKLILGTVAVVGFLSAWQGIRFWLYHGYSVGEHTGILRKVSVRGTPICKYLDGELALQGTQIGGPAEIWNFSIDDHAEGNPLMKQLHDAERNGKRVTIRYRQDLKSWWRCTPHEYFVTGVIESNEGQLPAPTPPPSPPAAQ